MPETDLILITHEHFDHTAVNIVTKKTNCKVLREKQMLSGGTYRTVSFPGGIIIRAVPAYNKNHKREECVGYVLSIDNIVVYAAGDTSYTDYMKDCLSKEHIDYALLPCDGIFNMDAKEASRCADIIGAIHVIPVHTNPETLFSQEVAEKFTAKNRLILHPGEEIILS